MIKIEHIEKSFADGETKIPAVRDVSLEIREDIFYGMVGTNGAGKSTLLRMMAGTLKPDGGTVTIDEREVYDNPAAKNLLFFIPDEPFYFHNSTPEDMANYYASVYDGFDLDRFRYIMAEFDLDAHRKIQTYSKGMKKQLSILLGIASARKYLLMDETFDGLDPVMRQAVKSLFAKEMVDRGLTPILTSHNLRELEDVCDHVGLLHKGGVLLSKDIEDMKLNIQKVQCVFENEDERAKFESRANVLTTENRGRLYVYTIRGSREEVDFHFNGINVTFCERLGLTLEEIFISETEVNGYDVKKFILE